MWRKKDFGAAEETFYLGADQAPFQHGGTGSLVFIGTEAADCLNADGDLKSRFE